MDQLNHSCPVDRPPMKANEPNILVKCVRIVLPLICLSFLDTFEKDVLRNGIDEYKVPVCVGVCMCRMLHTCMLVQCVSACVCVRVCVRVRVCMHAYVRCINTIRILCILNRGAVLKTKLRRTLQIN